MTSVRGRLGALEIRRHEGGHGLRGRASDRIVADAEPAGREHRREKGEDGDRGGEGLAG